EEEFEALLDQLHGKGRHGGLPTGAPAPAAAPQRPKTQAGESVSEADAKPGSAPGRSPGPAAAESARRRAPTATEQTVRVETAKLDQIMNMVGELVLVRNRLFNLKSRVEDEGITSAVATLDVVTSDLQNAVMKTRMQPIKKVFGRFPRLVRDLSRSMGKEVDLRMSGEDTDLDKNLVEALADPMIHLIRNAVDHGIEPPSQREKIGKPRQGRLTLEASQEGEQIVLKIRDDGRGMDAETLRRMAVEKGLMDAAAAERLEDRECFNLIFEAGFSTKKEISDISGRGVGMDVVKTRIAQMSGTVDIDSETGGGTTITIKLPLTLAILPTLMVMLAQQPFAIPLSSVVEIINLDWKAIHVVDGQKTLLVRNQALPLFFLRRHLVKQAGQPVPGETAHVVVIDLQGSPVGLVVDGLVGQEEVVIKPLGALLRGVEGMAGATITGDGKIALILDLPGLMRKLARHRRDPSGRMASG
ncbi:MAG: chemotaxis protein CheA, partial [Candidatus Sedimenticola endophacoides]